MNQRTTFIVGMVIILVALVVGGALVFGNSESEDSMKNMPSQSETPSNSTAVTESSEATQTTTVDIKDFAYAPEAIKVKVGDKVTWTNQDSAKHDVVMDDDAAEGPNSELLAKGESYSYTFTKAGTYEYHCSPHPYMKATVVVEE